jgi:hypothetical protein
MLIRWSNYDWNAFESEKRGPGPNAWADECVVLNGDGTLDLRIAYIGGKWRCAEIMSARSLGLGVYRWVVETDLSDLEPWAVLGLFTYDWQADAPYNELDIEASRWGWPTEENAGMCSCHAAPESNSWVKTFRWSASPPYRCQIDWRAKTVAFSVLDGKGTTLFSATPRRRYTHKDEKAYCNLWLSEGHEPVRGATAIKLSKFTHRPR